MREMLLTLASMHLASGLLAFFAAYHLNKLRDELRMVSDQVERLEGKTNAIFFAVEEHRSEYLGKLEREDGNVFRALAATRQAFAGARRVSDELPLRRVVVSELITHGTQPSRVMFTIPGVPWMCRLRELHVISGSPTDLFVREIFIGAMCIRSGQDGDLPATDLPLLRFTDDEARICPGVELRMQMRVDKAQPFYVMALVDLIPEERTSKHAQS